MYIDNDEEYIRIHIRFNGIYLPTMILQNYYYEILSVNDYQKVAVSSVIFLQRNFKEKQEAVFMLNLIFEMSDYQKVVGKYNADV